MRMTFSSIEKFTEKVVENDFFTGKVVEMYISIEKIY